VSFYSKELEEDLIERMVEFTIDNRKKTSDLQRKSKKIQDVSCSARSMASGPLEGQR
jgi:isocitrate dehydrogenase